LVHVHEYSKFMEIVSITLQSLVVWKSAFDKSAENEVALRFVAEAEQEDHDLDKFLKERHTFEIGVDG
jgi:hypothetical protein